MAKWDETFDLVIVGSGGGGLVAALAAKEAGLNPVILEKQDVVGGSTGMSGGIIWMPNNPLMRAEGVADSFEEGMAYLDAVVGAPDQASSLARRETFLRSGSEMITFLERKGVRFIRCEGYSDYYDNLRGGKARGRSIECVPWDGKQLGSWHSKIIDGQARHLKMAVKTNEIRNLPTFARTRGSFAATAKVVARTYAGRLRGKDLFMSGMSLVGQTTKAVLAAGIPLRLSTGVDEIIVEGGRVAGVRADHDGAPVLIRGEHGVLLAAGGFEHNQDMRHKYMSATHPSDASWTIGNPGSTGEMLRAAIALGAKTDYMDEAIWFLNTRPELAGQVGSLLVIARQLPRTIFVNKQGRRFVNEANSYVEVGNALFANDACPAWLIFDDVFRRRYPWVGGMPNVRDVASVVPGRMPQEWVTNGWMKKADTIEGLAGQMGLDPRVLSDTVRRFNETARHGQDPEFGRGESQYNKALADPANKPNPAVGPIDRGPFYATEIYPGDVGTAGGVITDEHAQVLDEADAPIPGLYATGNTTATVVGRTYPGAGASIANTMTFGYVAARHAATRVPTN